MILEDDTGIRPSFDRIIQSASVIAKRIPCWEGRVGVNFQWDLSATATKAVRVLKERDQAKS